MDVVSPGQHPDVEARLLAETERVLGGRPPTMADLPDLPYSEHGRARSDAALSARAGLRAANRSKT